MAFEEALSGIKMKFLKFFLNSMQLKRKTEANDVSYFGAIILRLDECLEGLEVQ